MAATPTTVYLNTEVVGSAGVVIAAVKLHEALYHDAEAVKALPLRIALAFGELQKAINDLSKQPVQVEVSQVDSRRLATIVARGDKRRGRDSS